MTDAAFALLMNRIGFRQLAEIPVLMHPSDVKAVVERVLLDATGRRIGHVQPISDADPRRMLAAVPQTDEDIMRSLEVGDGG